MEEKRSYTRAVERIKEKRRYVRVETEKDFPIEVQIMGDTFLDVLYTKDISTRGVGVWFILVKCFYNIF